MSIKAFKMGILAGNIMIPGFSTFISNLIMSSSIGASLKKELPNWMLEYCHGLTQEIYSIPFSNDIHH